jgi:2-dehydropantoate 2-reductase
MISDVFTKASIPVHLADNLGKARWEKLVWNMGFNGLTVILNVTTDRIMDNAASLSLVKEIMLEVIGGAKSCGYDLEEELAEIMITATRQMIDYSPSMKLDFEAGRSLEINEIYWRPIHAAKKSGFDMHKSRVLAYELEFINRLNQ